MARRLPFIFLAIIALYLPMLAQSPALTVDVPRKFDFVAYGDVRFTAPSDTRVSSPEARRAIVERVAAARPAFVLITGDLVLKGSDVRDWQVWDQETQPLRDAHVPVFPVLGNHDLSGDATGTNFLAHFPDLTGQRWYTLRARNVLCFMLDSDSDEPGSTQWQWLERQLSAVPAEVDFLVFVLHHPPYTNSENNALGGGHSSRPQEQKLAAMLEQRQASMRQRMIVIAGHVHSYERYEHAGITYIVSGGGGATPYKIPRSPQDPYRDPGPAYHFMRFSVADRQMRIEMNKLELADGKANWEVKDSLTLEAQKAGRAAAR
jgi:acid phosphatase type 7